MSGAEYSDRDLSESCTLEVRCGSHQQIDGKWIHSFTQQIFEFLPYDEHCSRHWRFSRGRQTKNLGLHTVCLLVGMGNGEGKQIRVLNKIKNNTCKEQNGLA